MADFRATPEKYPTLGALSRVARSIDQFARKPFGYDNPPVQALSDLLGIPSIYNTAENIAYGSPLTSGAGQARRVNPEVSEAMLASTNFVPAVGPTARLVKNTARASAPYAARQAVNLAEKYGVAPTMNVMKQKGGNWNKVKDLHHYDIVEINPESDVGQRIRAAGANVPRFLSQDQLTEILDRYGRSTIPSSPEGFAKGGYVEYDPDKVDGIVQGLRNYEPSEGMAPHGLRHSGEGVKGKGYFGLLPHASGMATEISADSPEIGEYPLIVPTLTREELDMLLSGSEPTEGVYGKAEAHALKRKASGKSAFAQPDELRYPTPEKFARGGAVKFAGGGLVTKFLKNFLKLEEPVNLSRRAALGIRPAETLPAVAPKPTPANPIETILNKPVSRRTVLKAMGSQAAQTIMPGLSSPLMQAAKQLSSPSTSSAVKQLYSLSPQSRTGALNMLPKASWDDHTPGIDRMGFVSRAIPEGLSLKEFLREIKSEPEVYSTFKKDLKRLEDDYRYYAAGEDKEKYLQYVPDRAKSRESKIWDLHNGVFKEPKTYIPENMPMRIFSKDSNVPYWMEELHPEVQDEIYSVLEGVTNKQATAALKYFKKEFGPELRAQSKERILFYDQAAKQATPAGMEVLDGGRLSQILRNSQNPVLNRVSLYRGVPSLDEINSRPSVKVNQEQYDQALEELKGLLSHSIYHPSYNKTYKGLGLTPPQYVPSEGSQFKLKTPLPEEINSPQVETGTPPVEKFARGGVVEYNPARIETLANKLREELHG